MLDDYDDDRDDLDETIDPVTHLPNRSAVETHLSRNARRIQSGVEPVAVLLVDIDDFSRVNARYGRANGDRVLRLIADRLLLATNTTSYRLSGDTFVVIVHSPRSRFDALAAAQRIQRRIAQPIAVDGDELQLSARVGVRVSFDGARDPVGFLRDAATALRQAKEQHRGAAVLFRQDVRRRRQGM
jgi:diguanylate cyclase (GGDEF)-like protein